LRTSDDRSAVLALIWPLNGTTEEREIFRRTWSLATDGVEIDEVLYQRILSAALSNGREFREALDLVERDMILCDAAEAAHVASPASISTLSEAGAGDASTGSAAVVDAAVADDPALAQATSLHEHSTDNATDTPRSDEDMDGSNESDAGDCFGLVQLFETASDNDDDHPTGIV
jgi:hypothetical protein